MKQTGDLLKKTREQRNLSLHEIGMSLKINPKTLQAIEEADLSKLPQKAFVRGFVKSYAQFLKLDAVNVLDLLTKEEDQALFSSKSTSTPNEVGSQQSPSLDTQTTHSILGQTSLHTRAVNPIEKPHAFLNVNSIALFLLGLALIATVTLVSKLVNKYQKERGSEVAKLELLKAQESEVAKNIAESTVTPTETTITQTEALPPPLSSTISQTAKLNNPAAAGATTSVPNTEAISSNPSAPIVEAPIANSNIESKIKVPVVTPVIAKEEKKAEDKVDKPLEVPLRPQEVIIEALRSVVIQYKLGTGKIESIELAAGDIHAFKSKSVVTLDISDGSAINVIVNGRDRGVPNKQGKPLHLTYPK